MQTLSSARGATGKLRRIDRRWRCAPVAFYGSILVELIFLSGFTTSTLPALLRPAFQSASVVATHDVSRPIVVVAKR
jgi:hypothetical protein